jgi:hypothetical protein
MQLTEPEVKDFFNLINGLMLYANRQLNIHPRIKSVKALVTAGAGPQADLCKVIYDDPTIIAGYADANPDGLTPADLATVRSWRFFIRGKFLVYCYTMDHTVFIHLEGGDPPKAYGVLSLNTPLPKLLGPDLPTMVDTTLLPFRSRIVHDGLIASYQISFGKGLRAIADGWYEQAIRAGGPITDLFGERSYGINNETGPAQQLRDSETPIPIEREAKEDLDLEALNDVLKQATDAHNRGSIDDFEGLCPEEMHWLLNAPFDPKRSPMQRVKDIPEELIKGMKFPEDMTQYLLIVKEEAPMKLTATGALTRAFCKRLCDKGLDERGLDWFKENPLMREDDSYYITLLDTFSRGMGFTKQLGPRLSLTREGSALLKASPSERFLAIFNLYAQKYDWDYGDRYPASRIIQQGFGFSLYLLSLYGREPHDDHLYSERFLNAFPMVLNDFEEGTYYTNEMQYHDTYSLRTVTRFMVRFGLAEDINKTKVKRSKVIIRKTQLFDALVRWRGNHK